MPCYETECVKCGRMQEILTLRASEKLPKCECGGNLKILPSVFTFRWAYSEGVWEEDESGRQVYKGPGGPSRIVGGEKLNVHDDLPEMADELPKNNYSSASRDSEGELLDEIDTTTLPEGVKY